MAKTDPKLDRIAEVPLFRRCSRKELRAVGAIVDELTIPAGTTLLRQGRAADHCYVIVDGEVEVEVDGEIVATVGSGQTVGEMALIDHRPRNATCRAVTDLKAMSVDTQRFDGLLDSTPGLAKALLAELSVRLRETDSQLVAAWH